MTYGTDLLERARARTRSEAINSIEDPRAPGWAIRRQTPADHACDRCGEVSSFTFRVGNGRFCPSCWGNP